MADDLKLSLGVELDLSDVQGQLNKVGGDKNKIKVSVDTKEAQKQINEFKESQKNKTPAKIKIDVLKGESQTNINNFVNDVQAKLQAKPLKITLDVDGKSVQANIQKIVGDIQKQVQNAVKQASNAASSTAKIGGNTNVSGGKGNLGSPLPEVGKIIEFENEFGQLERRITKVNDALGETREITEKIENDSITSRTTKTIHDYEAKAKAEENALKERQKQEEMYGKLMIQAEEKQRKAEEARAKEEHKRQDDYTKLHIQAREREAKEAERIRQSEAKAEQKKQDDYTKLYVQAERKRVKLEEQEEQKRIAAVADIEKREGKVNGYENLYLRGTTALQGNYADEARQKIQAIKDELKSLKEQASQSSDVVNKAVESQIDTKIDTLKQELDRLHKIEYPADKMAAVEVNAKQAGASNDLQELEEKLKSLNQETSSYSDRLNALKESLKGVGDIEGNGDAWAKWRNEFNLLQEDIKKFEASAQGMGQKLSSSIQTDQLKEINATVDKLNTVNASGVDAVKNDLQNLATEYQNVITQLQSGDLTKDQFTALSDRIKELDVQFKNLTKEAGNFAQGPSLDRYNASVDTLKLNLQKLEKQYADLIKKNPEVASRFENLRQQLENIRPGQIPVVSKDITNLGKECQLATGQVGGLRGALEQAFGGVGSYLARFTSAYFVITKVISGIKSMVNEVKAVDSSLVELQKVTDLTGQSLDAFTEKAYKVGEGLGRTGQDVIDAVTTFSRAGYDLNEATELAKSALVMTNVGPDIKNTESAASDMISILKAFDKQADESMSVIDKLYNVANKEPLDFGNITQMLVTAGGTLAQTGTSLEETMALLTGAFATLRDTSVSNG